MDPMLKNPIIVGGAEAYPVFIEAGRLARLEMEIPT
jgi:hypothetical protein